MKPALTSLFTVIKLTSGRRMYAFKQMRILAVAAGATDIVTHIDRAIAHEVEVHGLNRRWKAQKRPSKHAALLADIDNLTDNIVSALRDMLAAYIKGAVRGDANRAIAQRLLDELFPGGVYAITSLPYVEELAEVELVLEKLQGEFSAEVATLRLEYMVDRLASSAARYRELLSQAETLTFPEVRSARDRGHRFMLELMSMVLGRYYDTEDADHVNERTSLLEPIMEQDLAMRRYLRSRRGREKPAGELTDASADDDSGNDGDGNDGSDGNGTGDIRVAATGDIGAAAADDIEVNSGLRADGELCESDPRSSPWRRGSRSSAGCSGGSRQTPSASVALTSPADAPAHTNLIPGVGRIVEQYLAEQLAALRCGGTVRLPRGRDGMRDAPTQYATRRVAHGVAVPHLERV